MVLTDTVAAYVCVCLVKEPLHRNAVPLTGESAGWHCNVELGEGAVNLRVMLTHGAFGDSSRLMLGDIAWTCH
jgi:hypothetical protein